MVDRRLKPLFRTIDKFHKAINDRSIALGYGNTPEEGVPLRSARDDNVNGPFIQVSSYEVLVLYEVLVDFDSQPNSPL